ncbi:hypothetical protein [Streptobacillus moniliformis]|uniref:hypothetical protein n=1 Tax=Streptobacillus moniliformis TaxID=34105 RepID=UPI0007E441B1|nr:hypothetical protein [Streptobacillus moniliformis]
MILLLTVGEISFSAPESTQRTRRRNTNTLRNRNQNRRMVDANNSTNKNSSNNVQQRTTKSNVVVEREKNNNVKRVMLPSKSNLTGPRYRLEGAISAVPTNKWATFYQVISFLPEWKYQINRRVDITFGPKVSFVLTEIKEYQFIAGFVGAEADINFKVNDALKAYVALEYGVGLEWWIKYHDRSNKFSEKLRLIKGTFGFKINDKYNVGIYSSLEGKGRLGVEFGYTFK